jgi:magnesium and cobalt exporter, CNNM family
VSVEILVAMVLLSVVTNAFFAGVETGVTTSRRARLVYRGRRGDHGAARAAALVHSREASIVGAVVGNNLAVVTGTALATTLCLNYWPNTGESIAAVAMSATNIVFGEILPKSIYRAHPELMLARSSRVFVFGLRVLAPLQWIAVLLSGVVLRVGGLSSASSGADAGREELMRLVALSRSRAEISAQQGRFLRQLTRNSQLPVGQAMTPIERVSRVLEGASVQDARDCVRETGHSRIPMVDADGDIMGLLLFRDLFHHDPQLPVWGLHRESLRVVEEMGLDEAIAALIEARVGMASVVDVDGRTRGIVTLEDLFEPLVGEILDEHDRPRSISNNFGDTTH